MREPDASAYLASERGQAWVIDPKRGLCQIRSPARTSPGPAWASSAIAGGHRPLPGIRKASSHGTCLGPALGACGRAFSVPFQGCPACSRGGRFSQPRLTRVILWTAVPPRRATQKVRPQHSPEISRPDRRGPFFCRRLILPRDRPQSRSSLLPANPPSHVRLATSPSLWRGSLQSFVSGVSVRHGVVEVWRGLPPVGVTSAT